MVAFSVTERVVFPLGVSDGVEVTSPITTFGWHVSIGGLPFLTSTGDDRPYERAYVQLKKDQIDQQDEVGEQTLDNGYWLRNQSTFTGGAGRTYFESVSDPKARTRFHSSHNVNPWTDGEVTLLNGVTHVGSSTHLSITSGIADAVIWGTGSTWNGTEFLGDTPFTTALSAPANTSLVCSAGTTIIWGHAGGVNTLDSWYDSPSVARWTMGNVPDGLWWVKQRLILADGQDLYALGITAASAPLSGQTPIYTHPSTEWTWTSVTETPGAILAAGYDLNESAIYAFTLDEQGEVLTLTGAKTVAQFPPGESVYQILVYLGAYIAIATNQGIRAGIADVDGSVSYGPLSWESPRPDLPPGGMVGIDRFVYVSTAYGQATEETGLIRIDLSSMDENKRVAWADDLTSTYTGGAVTVGAVTRLGQSTRLAFATSDGIWVESVNKAASGWLRTAAVRYSMLEPKHFLYASVRGDTTPGQLALSTVDADGNTVSIISLSGPTATASDIALARSAFTNGEEQLSLKFDFTRDGDDATTGPTLSAWQMKAIPASARKLRIGVWLSCMDGESDGKGVKRTSPGSAWTRLRQLEALGGRGKRVRYTDYRTGESLMVTIEDLNFRSVTSQGRDPFRVGGYIYCLMREV